jgi:hypothetical protein
MAKWGWDSETLMFALDRIDAFENRFLALVFTGCTHSPYPDPGPQFRAGEHEVYSRVGWSQRMALSSRPMPWGAGTRKSSRMAAVSSGITSRTCEQIQKSQPPSANGPRERSPRTPAIRL